MPSVEEDLGGRGRPLYADERRGVRAGIGDGDQVAAPQRRQVVVAEVSVDSQIGPSTAPARAGRAPARAIVADRVARARSAPRSGATRRTAPAG